MLDLKKISIHAKNAMVASRHLSEQAHIALPQTINAAELAYQDILQMVRNLDDMAAEIERLRDENSQLAELCEEALDWFGTDFDPDDDRTWNMKTATEMFHYLDRVLREIRDARP